MIICPCFCLLLRQHWMLMRLNIHQVSSRPTTTSDDELCKWVKRTRTHTHTPYGLNYISQTLTQLVCIDFFLRGTKKYYCYAKVFFFKLQWYQIPGFSLFLVQNTTHESLPTWPRTRLVTSEKIQGDLCNTEGKEMMSSSTYAWGNPLLALNEGKKSRRSHAHDLLLPILLMVQKSC